MRGCPRCNAMGLSQDALDYCGEPFFGTHLDSLHSVQTSIYTDGVPACTDEEDALLQSWSSSSNVAGPCLVVHQFASHKLSGHSPCLEVHNLESNKLGQGWFGSTWIGDLHHFQNGAVVAKKVAVKIPFAAERSDMD
eukprot:3878867-Amphidinium_carterae.1